MAQAPALRALLRSYFGDVGIDRLEANLGLKPGRLHYWVRRGAVNRMPEAVKIQELSEATGIPVPALSAALASDAGLNFGDGVSYEELQIVQRLRAIPHNDRRTVLSVLNSAYDRVRAANSEAAQA